VRWLLGQVSVVRAEVVGITSERGTATFSSTLIGLHFSTDNVPISVRKGIHLSKISPVLSNTYAATSISLFTS